jgi:hypothetical protein
MSQQDVKRKLGGPREETSSMLFYHLVEGRDGGYYVDARLTFDERGLAEVKPGFGHVTMSRANE